MYFNETREMGLPGARYSNINKICQEIDSEAVFCLILLSNVKVL